MHDNLALALSLALLSAACASPSAKPAATGAPAKVAASASPATPVVTPHAPTLAAGPVQERKAPPVAEPEAPPEPPTDPDTDLSPAGGPYAIPSEGTPIYPIYKESIQQAAAPVLYVEIYPGGYYTLYTAGSSLSGTLSSEAMAKIEGWTANVEVSARAPRQGCTTEPVLYTNISVGEKVARFGDRCGAKPSASLRVLQGRIKRLLKY